MSVQWIEYKGKKILYVDLRGLRDDLVVKEVELEAKMIAASPTKVLILANVEGASIATMGQLKQLGKDVISPKTEKSAILGVTGLKDILYRAYNSFSGSGSLVFRTETEALEWLVK